MKIHSQSDTTWGDDAGTHLARIVKKHLAQEGHDTEVLISPAGGPATQQPGDTHLVKVAILGGPSVLFQVTDHQQGVQALDPHGHEFTLPEALEYVSLRATGETPPAALELTHHHDISRQRIAQRLKRGDRVETPRLVTHAFKVAKPDIQELSQVLHARGFTTTRFWIPFSRTLHATTSQPIDRNTVSAVTTEMVHLAHRHNATYTRWK